MNNFLFWAFGVWLPIIITAIIWSLAWKGMALWKAARQGDKGWFILFLIVNTLGILEILYIYIFSEDKSKRQLVTNTPEDQKGEKV